MIRTFEVKDPEEYAKFKANCVKNDIKIGDTIMSMIELYNKIGDKIFEKDGKD